MKAAPAGIEIRHEPGVVSLLAASLYRAAFRSQGRLAHGDLAGFPALSATRRGVRVDRARLAAYALLCGFDVGASVLPLPYPESLCFPLLAAIATSAAFPLSPLGLIHVGQALAQTRPLRADERLDLRCVVAGAEPGPRGITVRIAMTGTCAGESVWSGEAELLSRSAETTRVASTRGRQRESLPLADPAGAASIGIDVPEDTGRRYARISGDWNPHHLHWTLARLLGYPRPIAHGMWTLARALAELEGAGVGPLARAEARFRKPLFMPRRARLHWKTTGDAVAFEVHDAEGPAVHLTGRAQP